LLASLSASDITPERTLETSRNLAAAVSQELRDQKLKPNDFKAVLNDVPAHARGALEDALKSVNVTPAYLAQNEKNGFDVVKPLTDRAVTRPNPPAGAEQIGLSAVAAERSALSSRQSDVQPAKASLGPETEQLRSIDELRNRLSAVAAELKAEFDRAETPAGARQAVVDVPAHLTGAMESALARQGITAVHAQERSGALVEGATLHAGAEQRGLKTVRDAFGAEGKGVSDNQIRQTLGSERLQDIGRNPKMLTPESVETALAARPETIHETNRRVNAVFEAAQTVSRPPLELPREAQTTPDSMGPHLPVLKRAELKELEPEQRLQQSEPKSVSTLDRGSANGEKPPTNAQLGTEMLRSYIATTSPGGINLKNGAKLEDGMRTYVGVVRDPAQNRIMNKSGKVDIGYLVVDGAKLAMEKLDKLEGRVPPPTEKEISTHIRRETLEAFAKEGVPHRELDALSNKLTEAAARHGVPPPDKLDAVHLRQTAMDLKVDSNAVVTHKGQALCTVSELRQELAKVNTMESQAREQLRGVLPEKGFDAAVKQLDLRTVQDIAKNGVDRNLVSVLKAQMQEKNSGNPGWFKTADALNAISAARSNLSGSSVISTSASVEGKRYEGASVMVAVDDMRQEVATALRTLGREKDWDVQALQYGETPKYSGGPGRVNEGPATPTLPDARTTEAVARLPEGGSRAEPSMDGQGKTEPSLSGLERESSKSEMQGRTEPTLDSPRNDQAGDGNREDSSSRDKDKPSERQESERSEAQEKIRTEDQRQATFAREMTR
jgi:hypothetical protein